MQLLHRFFQSIPTSEYKELEATLRITRKEIPKSGVLFRQSDRSRYVFLLLSGKAHAVRYASDGREVDYTVFIAGDLLSEASDYLHSCKSDQTVFADTPCVIMYFPYEALNKCSHPLAQSATRALWSTFAVQYEVLKRRVGYITCGSLREKILAYLNNECAGEDWFEIPLDRNGLASYLFCDRTALCRELSKLRKEGLIDFHKNKFRFLTPGIVKND